MTPVLGIDLGTTNSVVCVAEDGQTRVLPDAEGNELIPSVVSFHPAGDVLVGQTARERRLLDAKNTVYSVKRLIGRPFSSPEVRRAQERFPFELCEGASNSVLVRVRDETYTLPEISAFVLREVRRIAEERIGVRCDHAVITVPANFNELQRSATKAAGKVAGLEVLRILNEPTAAALAYGYGKGSRERVAVFDLGGGTFDITILELAGDVFEVLSTAGDTFLGGDDIDLLIADKMADAFLQHHRFDPRANSQAYERLRAAAEWAKCQLSSEPEVQLRIEELAYGEGGASLDLTFGITRPAFEQLTQPLVARALDVCEDAMRVAGIRPTQLDNVILVGGSTRIPLVRSMVSDYFGREALSFIDPDLVVARGAALQAFALAPQSAGDTIGRRLGRVSLKRVTQAELEAARPRPRPAARARTRPPSQPAFQPPRPPPPTWGELDGAITRVAPSEPPRWEEETSADFLSQPTRVAPHPSRPLDAGLLFDDETAPATVTASASYEERVRASRPPDGPPRIEEDRQDGAGDRVVPNRRGRGFSPGESTLVFGSVGLPVPDFDGASLEGPLQPSRSGPPPPPPGPSEPTRATAGPPPPPPPRAAVLLPAPVPVLSRPVPSHPAPSHPAPSHPPPATTDHPSSPPPGLPAADEASRAFPSVAPPDLPPSRPPLLLDVTPHTLGIETVGGFCEGVIVRNAAIPVEHTRLFSTGMDNQESFSVRIFQGESRRIEENQPLGQIELSGLRQAVRGAVQIEVTFLMDADGTLGVRARDAETGREQTVRINLLGGVGEDEIRRMQERQARMMGEAG